MSVEIVRDSATDARLVFRYKREGTPSERRVRHLLSGMHGYELLSIETVQNLVVATVHKC